MAFPRSLPVLGTAVVLAASVLGCRYLPERINLFAHYTDQKAKPQIARIDQLLASNAFEEKRLDPKKQKNSLMFTKARLLEFDKEFEQAVKHYEDIIESDPDYSPALHRLAVLHTKMGHPEPAARHFQAALRVENDHAQLDDDDLAQLHNDYGYFCYLSSEWDVAEKHLGRAVELNSSLREAHNNLGLLHTRLGDYGKARYHFQKSGCNRAESLNNLAFARLLEDDYEGAMLSYQLALDADPSNLNAQEGLDATNHLVNVANKNEGNSSHDKVRIVNRDD